jgi:hypothetical protein
MQIKVTPYTLEPSSGNGAVPNAVYTMLVPANPKRRWFVVKVPGTEANSMLVVLSRGTPGVDATANILLEPGDAAVFSNDGDMPWQGAILATGLVGATSCYWSQAEDYP